MGEREDLGCHGNNQGDWSGQEGSKKGEVLWTLLCARVKEMKSIREGQFGQPLQERTFSYVGQCPLCVYLVST